MRSEIVRVLVDEWPNGAPEQRIAEQIVCERGADREQDVTDEEHDKKHADLGRGPQRVDRDEHHQKNLAVFDEARPHAIRIRSHRIPQDGPPKPRSEQPEERGCAERLPLDEQAEQRGCHDKGGARDPVREDDEHIDEEQDERGCPEQLPRTLWGSWVHRGSAGSWGRAGMLRASRPASRCPSQTWRTSARHNAVL